jgi:heme/copper-type cytochrome/quinol oxidase subunit 2
MRGTIIVETQEEFDRWIFSQTPQYYVAFPDKNPGAKTVVDSTKAVGSVAGKTAPVIMVQAKK